MASISKSKYMAGVLVELYKGLSTMEDRTEFQDEQYGTIYNCLKDVGVIEPCSACDNEFFSKDLTTRTKCCDLISRFCKKCLKRHDRECDKFHENLEKFQKEKLENYLSKDKTDKRTSRKQAENMGLIQCSCKRHFKPELKKNGTEYYKSCDVCRAKRKATKNEVEEAGNDPEAKADIKELQKELQVQVLKDKKKKLKEEAPEPLPKAKKAPEVKTPEPKLEIKEIKSYTRTFTSKGKELNPDLSKLDPKRDVGPLKILKLDLLK